MRDTDTDCYDDGVSAPIISRLQPAAHFRQASFRYLFGGSVEEGYQPGRIGAQQQGKNGRIIMEIFIFGRNRGTCTNPVV